MISIKTNINVVNSSLMKKIAVLRNPGQFLRPVALDVLVLMTTRIHEEGKAADDSQIGQYNNRYLRLRQKNFKRTAEKKIIVSLTRQLENDWSVVGTQRGWGIGFKNKLNAQKLKWVEEQKKKKIGALTKSEHDFAIQKLKKEVSKALAQ